MNESRPLASIFTLPRMATDGLVVLSCSPSSARAMGNAEQAAAWDHRHAHKVLPWYMR